MAAKKKPKVKAKDLQGFKYFKLLNPLLERLHDLGTERDQAGNRQLFFDQYAALLPIYERVRMQFRFEAVNALNHPWYGSIASVDVTSPQFGRLNPTEQNLPRFLKLGLNLQF